MSAYLNTRVSLLSAHLWTDRALEELAGASDEGMADMLSRHGLAQLTPNPEDRPGQSPAPHSLEQRIVTQLLDETRLLIRPLSSEARAFLTYWTARFEMTNVKTLIRSKMADERPAAILSRLTPMGAFGRLDHQELALAEDVAELFRRLEAGPYAGIVRHARRAFEQSQDPFHLDAALDRGYYDGLTQRARPLEKTAGDAFRALMAHLIDRINLVWLLRYRFNYRLPPAQVYYLLVNSRYSLTGPRLQELAALDSLEAVLLALPPPWKERLSDSADIAAIFATMEQFAAQEARRQLRNHAPEIARAFAYLILRERDLRSIRSVLRGHHLGLDVADIRLALRRNASELH